MYKHVLAITAALALISGCESIHTPMDDGYQFGDITATGLALRTRYCAVAEDSKARDAVGDALRAHGVPIPSGGVCTEILDALTSNDR